MLMKVYTTMMFLPWMVGKLGLSDEKDERDARCIDSGHWRVGWPIQTVLRLILPAIERSFGRP